MIDVGGDGAVLLVGGAAVAALGWSVGVSIRAASRGPRWALGHFIAADRVIVAAAACGGLVGVLVDPLWAGIGIIYVAAVVWLLAGVVRRILEHAAVAGDLDGLAPHRRAAIVLAARRRFAVLGIVIGVVAAAAWTVGPPAWVGAAAGAVLVAAALVLR